MSDSNKEIKVNQSEEAVELLVAAFCTSSPPLNLSPIDDYYAHATALVLKSAQPDIGSDDVMIRLLLLGVMSAAEFYFRSVLAGVIQICPKCRSAASNHMVSLGSVYYYTPERLGLALLENTSFSTAGVVKKETEKLAALRIPQNSSVDVALASFDRVGHLRHAAVHSRGELNGKNVRDLELECDAVQSLNLTPISLQNLVAVCHNAVRAYNGFLFTAMVNRWLSDPLLTGDWSQDQSLFEPLFNLLYSKRDNIMPNLPSDAYLILQPRILSRIKTGV